MIKRALLLSLVAVAACSSGDSTSDTSNAADASATTDAGTDQTDSAATDTDASTSTTDAATQTGGPTAKSVPLGTCETTADGTNIGPTSSSESDKTIATLGEKNGVKSATLQCQHDSTGGISIIQFTASNFTSPGSFKGERVTMAGSTQFVCVAQYGAPPSTSGGGQVISSLGGECALTVTNQTADAIEGAFSFKVAGGASILSHFNLAIKK